VKSSDLKNIGFKEIGEWKLKDNCCLECEISDEYKNSPGVYAFVLDRELDFCNLSKLKKIIESIRHSPNISLNKFSNCDRLKKLLLTNIQTRKQLEKLKERVEKIERVRYKSDIIYIGETESSFKERCRNYNKTHNESNTTNIKVFLAIHILGDLGYTIRIYGKHLENECEVKSFLSLIQEKFNKGYGYNFSFVNFYLNKSDLKTLLEVCEGILLCLFLCTHNIPTLLNEEIKIKF